LEIDVFNLRGNAEFFRFPDFDDSIRRIDEDFRGDSTGIEAGAAQRSLVHEGHGLVMLKRVLDKIRARARADDNDVVFFHDLPLVEL
jgi:hypothetical protein